MLLIKQIIQTNDLHPLLITSDNEISLNGLHKGQGVYLHRAAFPLFNISAIWVSLQLTLELVCVEEFQCLRAPVATYWNNILKMFT